MADKNKEAAADLREQLADQEHDRWSRWMRYLFSKSEIKEDGTAVIPAELVERWQRQMNTPYDELSEPEKESDRKEADRTLKVISK